MGVGLIFEVEGLAELIDKLEELEDTAKLVRPTLLKAGDEYINAVGKYPPETSANRPRPGGWYQRGYGPKWYGGKGGSATSQQLGKRWTREAGDREITIRNAATYAAFVHGKLEQVGFHAVRGWKRVDTVAEELMPKIIKGLTDQINRIWNRQG